MGDRSKSEGKKGNGERRGKGREWEKEARVKGGERRERGEGRGKCFWHLLA